MTSTSRKKSLHSAAPPPTPLDLALPLSTPIAQNTLLNKGASSSSSLYQQCSLLRARLARVDGFPAFFPLVRSATAAGAPPPSSSITPSSQPDYSARASTPAPQVQAKRDSSNPVTQLWDLFKLGVPLTYLWNLHPPGNAAPIKVPSDPATLDLGSHTVKDAKHATAMFIMAIGRLQAGGQWSGVELFNVSELMGDDTNGFVKVVHAVSYLLDLMPQHLLPLPSPPPDPANNVVHASHAHLSAPAQVSAPSGPSAPPLDAAERERRHVTSELLDTERKYVQDLEVLHQYARDLAHDNIVSRDTIHNIFSNLSHILDHQRRFLIELEKTAELPRAEQDLGVVFVGAQQLFEYYIPYCANFTSATELVVKIQDELMVAAEKTRINPRSELPAFLIKPVQRICKYPLMLDQLLKCTPANDPHRASLAAGLAAAKHYTDRVNEAQRAVENELTLAALANRVQDWKGHTLPSFGALVLDDIFMVTKGDVDREYVVLLFEKIILCCKEQIPQPPGQWDTRGKGGKMNLMVGKSNSLLMKKGGGQYNEPPRPPPMKGNKTTPLTLKGRIYLNNITAAKAVAAPSTAVPGQTAHYLQVFWNGDVEMESFVLRCRTEEQLRLWETQITRLVNMHRQRRASEKQQQAAQRNELASQSIQDMMNRPAHERLMSGGLPSNPRRGAVPFYTGSSNDSDGETVWGGGQSGRETPAFKRRDHAASASAAAMGAAEKVVVPPRARTEGTDGPTTTAWRQGERPQLYQQQSMPYGQSFSPFPQMPALPRMLSSASAASAASEASFGNTTVPLPPSPLASSVFPPTQPPPPPPPKPAVRSQPSSSRLRNAYGSASTPEINGSQQVKAAYRPTPSRMESSQSVSSGTRSRSSSTPAPYIPPRELPPVPMPMPLPPPAMRNPSQSSSGNWGLSAQPVSLSFPRTMSGTAMPKRESGSSQSTAADGTDSDSPTYQSPDTPFGSTDSTLLASAHTQTQTQRLPPPPLPQQQQLPPHAPLRPARSQVFTSQSSSSSRTRSPLPSTPLPLPPPSAAAAPTIKEPVTVKVHFRQDLFAVVVPRSVGHRELMEKVHKKIRLCTGERENVDRPLRVKYQDEEGDLVSLGGTDDLQMAFDLAVSMHNNLVQLYVA